IELGAQLGAGGVAHGIAITVDPQVPERHAARAGYVGREIPLRADHAEDLPRPPYEAGKVVDVVEAQELDPDPFVVVVDAGTAGSAWRRYLREEARRRRVDVIGV